MTKELPDNIVMGEEIFVSHKQVLKHPMNRLDYNNYRGWELPEDEDGADEGYLVEYLDGGMSNDSRHDGYISWSPKEQFDNGYVSLEEDSHSVTINGEEHSITSDVSDLIIMISEERDELKKHQTLSKEKTLHNSTVSVAKENVSDHTTYGNCDTFQLICKASSKNEGWMKSTKAMEIFQTGCLVQVTTQQGDNIAEALTFVPGVRIQLLDTRDKNKGRKLVQI